MDKEADLGRRTAIRGSLPRVEGRVLPLGIAMRLLLAVLVATFIAGAAGAETEADRSAIRGIVQDQIEAFKRDDAARAFSHAAPSLQRMFGSQDRFMALVKEGYKPVYRPRSYAFGEFKDGPDGPSLSVDIQDNDGIDWVALYTLEQQPDGSWRISGCYLLKAPGQTA